MAGSPTVCHANSPTSSRRQLKYGKDMAEMKNEFRKLFFKGLRAGRQQSVDKLRGLLARNAGPNGRYLTMAELARQLKSDQGTDFGEEELIEEMAQIERELQQQADEMLMDSYCHEQDSVFEPRYSCVGCDKPVVDYAAHSNVLCEDCLQAFCAQTSFD